MVQESIAKGSSYQIEVLKLLCEISDKLDIIGNLKATSITSMLEDIKTEYTPKIEIPLKIKKKAGRPPKRR